MKLYGSSPESSTLLTAVSEWKMIQMKLDFDGWSNKLDCWEPSESLRDGCTHSVQDSFIIVIHKTTRPCGHSNFFRAVFCWCLVPFRRFSCRYLTDSIRDLMAATSWTVFGSVQDFTSSRVFTNILWLVSTGMIHHRKKFGPLNSIMRTS